MLYKDCNLPAKLFFKVLSTQDYTLLGEGTPEEQENAYYAIYDEFCLLSPNDELKRIYNKKAKIERLYMKIAFIETVLYNIVYLKLTVEERLEFVNELNLLEGVAVKFNPDMPIKDEVIRIQTRVIGALKTQIKAEEATEEKQRKVVPYNFEQSLSSICLALGIYLHPEITLYEYVAYRNSAMEKIKAQEKLKRQKK